MVIECTGLVRVQSVQAERNICREMYRAWTWNLLTFLDPVSTVCALVWKANRKKWDDKKGSLEER